jgi:hypothetical protein
MIAKTRSAPPRAGAMLESLRGLGYTTPAALADVIDNSISAGSSQVNIEFVWDGFQSHVSIMDNGTGMDDAELQCAMTLGDKSPLDARAPQDLGRFGMGLKTASFSQCRRLTVGSVKGASRACLRWDLEALAADSDGGWLLFEGPEAGSEKFLEPLSTMQSGTIVLWESMDRIVTAGFTADDFNDLVDSIDNHLAMVFHRLLQGPRPRLRIFINKRPVDPWDPFMSGHSAKPWSSPVVRKMTDAGPVEIECHVLPHKDKLTEQEFARDGGPEGWTAQQGFYVYRNERLLVAGGWLGLGYGRPWNREEVHRLARIRLDIPNTADAAWKIDIRKSKARPPVSLREWLNKYAENTRKIARETFAFRTAPMMTGNSRIVVEQAWRVEKLKSGIRYRIDEKHAVVAATLDACGPQLELVRAMLRIIEETVPVQRIWLDTAESKEIPLTGFSGEPPGAIKEVLQIIYADMVGRKGMSSEMAKRALLSIEPFQNYPALVNSIPDANS